MAYGRVCFISIAHVVFLLLVVGLKHNATKKVDQRKEELNYLDEILIRWLGNGLSTLNTKPFLSWMTNYLCDRCQYVQIDDKKLTLKFLQFGVPQGSILGPLLFNIYTADMQDNLNNNSISCFQYCDDTTLYKQSTINELVQNVTDFNNSLRNMASWSNKSNLALNPVKTKQMVLSTNQLARVHELNNHTIQLEILNRQLERVSETKLLGVKLQENLKWNDHVKDVAIALDGWMDGSQYVLAGGKSKQKCYTVVIKLMSNVRRKRHL